MVRDKGQGIFTVELYNFVGLTTKGLNLDEFKSEELHLQHNIKVQFETHRKHIISALNRPAGSCFQGGKIDV
jgi:hypothetical protein